MVLNDYYLCYVNDRLAIYLQYNLNKYNKVLFRFISSSTIKCYWDPKFTNTRTQCHRNHAESPRHAYAEKLNAHDTTKYYPRAIPIPPQTAPQPIRTTPEVTQRHPTAIEFLATPPPQSRPISSWWCHANLSNQHQQMPLPSIRTPPNPLKRPHTSHKSTPPCLLNTNTVKSSLPQPSFQPAHSASSSSVNSTKQCAVPPPNT